MKSHGMQAAAGVPHLQTGISILLLCEYMGPGVTSDTSMGFFISLLFLCMLCTHRCLVQVSYAIGVPEPLSVYVDTYGTGKDSDAEILVKIQTAFDFRPGMIGKSLDLKRGGNKRYQKTAAYGHFGRDDPDFTWEKAITL